VGELIQPLSEGNRVFSFWRTLLVSFRGLQDHLHHPEAVISIWIGTGRPIARQKEPKLLPVFANILRRQGRIVPSLGFEILGVEQIPRAPGCEGLVELQTRLSLWKYTLRSASSRMVKTVELRELRDLRSDCAGLC